MKKLIKIIVVLILLVLVGVVIVFMRIDAIAKTAIERSSTHALGVPTTLQKADVKILSGQFAMNGLNVSNPQGYQSNHFLKLDDGGVAVSFASLRQETIELPNLTLTGVDVNIEKKDGKANYQVILDNLKKLESGEKDPDAPKEDSRKFVIRKLQIKNVNVHVDTGVTKLDVPVDEIVLTDVGAGGSVRMSDLAGILIKAVLTAVVQNAGHSIPDALAGELKGALGQLEGLEKIADIEKLGGIGKDAGKVMGDLGDKIPEVGDKVKEGLGGLLDGDKKKE